MFTSSDSTMHGTSRLHFGKRESLMNHRKKRSVTTVPLNFQLTNKESNKAVNRKRIQHQRTSSTYLKLRHFILIARLALRTRTMASPEGHSFAFHKNVREVPLTYFNIDGV